MSAPAGEWQEWRAQWQHADVPVQAARDPHAAIREERERARRVAWAEGVMAVLALAPIAAALAHAPAPDDVARAGGIAALIAVAAVLRALDRRAPRADDSTTAYLGQALRGARRRLRGVCFAGVLLALELGFFIPWWIDGVRIHGIGFDPLSVVSAWVPMALFAGFAVWLAIRFARLRGEIRRLSALDEALSEP